MRPANGKIDRRRRRYRRAQVRGCSSVKIRFLQQLLERVLVCGQKQLVFLATGGLFGCDDVEQPRRGNLDPFDAEHMAFVPDGLELESFHHEREIDQEFVGPSGSRQRTACDYLLSKPAITGTVERFIREP